MDDDAIVESVGELSDALGYNRGGWTDMLLHLIAEADHRNRVRLSNEFPYEVALYERWYSGSPAPTAALVRHWWQDVRDNL